MASGDNTWFLVISPSDYSVHQQNGASAHNAGFIHQKCKEALRAVILKKTPDYLPHLNFLDLNRGAFCRCGVWKSPHRNLNSLGAHIVDVWEMMDVRHIRKIASLSYSVWKQS